MKKITSYFILGVCILFAFSACQANNTQQNNSNQTNTVANAEKTLKIKVFSYMGNDYPVNVMPDFDVNYMYCEEDEDGVCWVSFLSDDDIDNYDFSNGPAHEITYLYSGKYSDLFSEEPEILGSYSVVYTGQNDGWQILYAPDGDIIFKTRLALTVESGLHGIYYDNNDNIIAEYSGYDKVNEKSLFEKADGQIINEDELSSLLESLCPNDVLKSCV